MSTSAPVRSQQALVIGVFDLSGFLKAIREFDDARLSDVVDRVYTTIAEAVTGSGGRVVKYLGDGALAVWPSERADDAVVAAMAMRGRIVTVVDAFGLKSEMVCRFHHADVMAGEFGPDRGVDIMGGAVFTTFRLPARTISVSVEAFRSLSPDTRRLLRKHTEPVVYIPVGDPRP